MSSYSPDRQRASVGIGKGDNERILRQESAQELIHELIGDNQEEFSNPAVRLEFVESLSGQELYDVAQHINRRMRGMDSKEMRSYGRDTGSFLPMMHTPKSQDKIPAFMRGVDAIHEYIRDSDDSVEQKLQGVSLGVGALIIRVHPFNDGNGRTSRFLGEFIESGAEDTDRLVDAAIANAGRQRTFNRGYLTREAALSNANNTELMLEDEEREEFRKKAETLPNDIEATYLTIKRLLEDDEWRSRTELKAS